MEVKHNDHIARQCKNNHVMIFNAQGKRVLHSPCTTSKTEQQLKDMINDYLVLVDELADIYEQ